MINWTCLDMRQGSQLPKDAFNKLCKPGATTTWGVDFRQHTGTGGFCCFRIVQIGDNSSGCNKLKMANLEVYGVPTNPEMWAFHD